MLQRIVVGCFAILLVSLSTLFVHKNLFKTVTRAPAGLADSAVKTLFNDIYSTALRLGSIPVDEIKELVIEEALESYIDDFKVSDDVKARLKDKINDPQFMRQVVPFIWSLKKQYTLPDNHQELKFETFIKTQYKPGDVPGLEHPLFQFNSAAKDNSGFELSDTIVGYAVYLFDSIFLTSRLGFAEDRLVTEPFRRLEVSDQSLIDKAKPHVRGLLEELVEHLKAGQPTEGATSEIISSIEGILKDDLRFEAVTVTLIDFVGLMAHKSYRMFALRLIRAHDIKSWMLDRLEDSQPLIDVLNHRLYQQKYAAHIVVDGLQGHLLKALAMPDSNEAFLQKVLADFKEREKFKPQSEVVSEPKENQVMSFFAHLASKKKTGEAFLPFFKSTYKSYQKTIARTGISTTPTISVRNLPIAFTGATVAGPMSTGIPNFHFVDRKKDRAYYFFGNDALLLEEIASENGLKSVFSRLSHLNTLNCFAQYDWESTTTYEALVNLGVGEGFRDFGELLCLEGLKQRAHQELKNRADAMELVEDLVAIRNWPSAINWIFKRRAKQLIKRLAKNYNSGLPQYFIYYNPWPDHFAHFYGPFSDAIVSPTGELNRLDFWLSRLEVAYSLGGVSDRTLFGMAGDHGLTPIFYLLNPEVQVIEKFSRETGRKVEVRKISSDEGEGPKINHSIRPPSVKGVDIVIASTAGGNYMMDFFKSQSTEEWRVQPTYKDLVKLRLIHDGQPVNWIKEITSRLRETLDYLAVREAACSLKRCQLRIMGYRNGNLTSELISRDGDQIYYKPSNGQLLEINQLTDWHGVLSVKEQNEYAMLFKSCVTDSLPDEPETWCDEKTWLRLTQYTNRPGAVTQLAHLFDVDEAGTINLFPRTGIGYNSRVPGRHAGEHFHEKDAFVGFWGKPSQWMRPIGPTLNGSVAPTLFKHVSSESVEVSTEGWGFPAKN